MRRWIGVAVMATMACSSATKGAPVVDEGDEVPIDESDGGDEGGAVVLDGGATPKGDAGKDASDAGAGPYAVALTSVGVILISSADGQCERSRDRAIKRSSTLLSISPSMALRVGTSAAAVVRTAFDGSCAQDGEAATSATVTMASASGGRYVGTYEATFASGTERGSFVADACDAPVSSSTERTCE